MDHSPEQEHNGEAEIAPLTTVFHIDKGAIIQHFCKDLNSYQHLYNISIQKYR